MFLHVCTFLLLFIAFSVLQREEVEPFFMRPLSPSGVVMSPLCYVARATLSDCAMRCCASLGDTHRVFFHNKRSTDALRGCVVKIFISFVFFLRFWSIEQCVVSCTRP